MAVEKKLFDSVITHIRQAVILQTSADTLEWDERTGMPELASEYRSQQVSLLRAKTHDMRTDPGYGDRLSMLKEQAADEDPICDEKITIDRLHRDWQRDCKLPTDLVRRTSIATVRGQQQWDAARREDDYSMLHKTLQSIVSLKREAGRRLAEGTSRSAYEALMDEYEPDVSLEHLQRVFDDLRGPLVGLIQEIQGAQRQPDEDVLSGEFPISVQREFCRDVAQRVGFDFKRGRLDETSHPFCTTLGPHDCRILTHYHPSNFSSALFGVLHEAGHGMYEQGMRTDWFGLPPGSYVSLGIHESQSRLWENQVGRSRAFWEWLFDESKQTFSPQLDAVSLDEFHFAINRVRPSLIRVEADEVTYNLHIMIRFDLERSLIDGSLAVVDLPDAWNERYESDLGIRPKTACEGVLQDVHWSAGLIGYFPTYTLGNLAASQLLSTACRKLGDLDPKICQGDFAPLSHWLHENVHQLGRRYSGEDLIVHITEKPLGSECLLNYLNGKLRPLYELTGTP